MKFTAENKFEIYFNRIFYSLEEKKMAYKLLDYLLMFMNVIFKIIGAKSPNLSKDMFFCFLVNRLENITRAF